MDRDIRTPPLLSHRMKARVICRLGGTLMLLAALWAPPAHGQLVDRDPVVAAAGDIACDPADPAFNGGLGTGDRCRQLQTSDLLLGEDLAAVLALGDTQYEDGLYEKFLNSYDLSWGRLKAITRPVAGNHEYFADGGAGYFDYFNGIGAFSGPAGDRDKGYYSFDVGSWHLIALNSICSQAGGCGHGSPQEQWLRADLAAHPAQCTLAYWHHPPVVSDGMGWPSMDAIWRVLQDAGVDVVLTGHSHQYERFAPLDAAGGVDPAQGIRLFIVGTGGKSLSRPRSPSPGSEAQSTGAYGVLLVTLRDGGYEWEFLRESGEPFSDTGSVACHGARPAQPPEALTGPASNVRGTSALLNGALDARDQPASFHYEWGPTPAYGFSTPETAVASGPGGRRPVSARLTGLSPGTVYHYRLVATTALGTVAGESRTLRADSRSAYADAVERTPGLLSHWRLGDGTGAVAFDGMGRSLGAYAGGYALGRSGAVSDRDTAAAFDGATGSARLFGPSLSVTGSIEGWFRWTAGESLIRDDASGGAWMVGQANDRLIYRIAGTTFRTGRRLDQVMDGAWHHVVVTKDADFVQLYVDGLLVHESGGAPDTPPTMPWYVMRSGPFAAHSQGVADDIAIYDRPLPARTVREHWEAGAARVTPETRVVAPTGAINDASPTIRVHSTKRRSTIRCAIRSAGSAAALDRCRARTSYPGLPDGQYSFTAYATGPTGHPDPTPARTSFRVDTVTPDVGLELSERPLGRLVRLGLPATVTCSEPCRLRARLVLARSEARRLRLSARRALEVARVKRRVRRAGASRSVRLTLRRDARRALARRRSLRATFRLSVFDAAGNMRGTSRSLRFRR